MNKEKIQTHQNSKIQENPNLNTSQKEQPRQTILKSQVPSLETIS